MGKQLVNKKKNSFSTAESLLVFVETQEISPIVGKIYKLRYCLHELFEINDGKSSTVTSSSTSSKSSSRKTPKIPNKRPCLVIGKSLESAHVLIITRFHHMDSISVEVLPQLSRENLLKYTLSIHPSPPLYGRRSVKITSSQSPSYFNPSEKSYIILKPIIVSLKEQWPNPLPDYIDDDEILYIRDTLLNTFIKEHAASVEKPKIIRNNSENNDNEDNNTTTSTSSSLPSPLFARKSFGHTDSSLNKSKEIEKWLADVESSPECTIELNDQLN